ncbi:MAG: glycosyltransferase [Candidatus Peribacteraceae bacterium]|jgi:glycosyltransferase involved in cell wall biosynthesis
MRLLFITQKLHGQDSFGIHWVREFRRQGFDVTVLCLEDLVSPLEFPVLSLGKEIGIGKVGQVIRFFRHIVTARYDRVFIHMSPVWGLLGAWWWVPCRIPVYLWYTHYKNSCSFRVTASFAKRLFCATSQSMPTYEGSPKKVVCGHGIDLSVWPKRENKSEDPRSLVAVHRLSRSKRVELLLRALTLLPGYRLDIFGIAAEPDYVAELKALTKELGLDRRAAFHGTVPLHLLPQVYSMHRLILNEASETIDKTMLEAMTCGCYPVTTKRNAEAIGIPFAPEEDTPEAIAAFVTEHAERLPMNPEEMYNVVKERHSLEGLVRKMGEYIRSGT